MVGILPKIQLIFPQQLITEFQFANKEANPNIPSLINQDMIL